MTEILVAEKPLFLGALGIVCLGMVIWQFLKRLPLEKQWAAAWRLPILLMVAAGLAAASVWEINGVAEYLVQHSGWEYKPAFLFGALPVMTSFSLMIISKMKQGITATFLSLCAVLVGLSAIYFAMQGKQEADLSTYLAERKTERALIQAKINAEESALTPLITRKLSLEAQRNQLTLAAIPNYTPLRNCETIPAKQQEACRKLNRQIKTENERLKSDFDRQNSAANSQKTDLKLQSESLASEIKPINERLLAAKSSLDEFDEQTKQGSAELTTKVWWDNTLMSLYPELCTLSFSFLLIFLASELRLKMKEKLPAHDFAHFCATVSSDIEHAEKMQNNAFNAESVNDLAGYAKAQLLAGKIKPTQRSIESTLSCTRHEAERVLELLANEGVLICHKKQSGKTERRHYVVNLNFYDAPRPQLRLVGGNSS